MIFVVFYVDGAAEHSMSDLNNFVTLILGVRFFCSEGVHGAQQPMLQSIIYMF